MAGTLHPRVYWVDARDVGRLAVVSRPEASLLPEHMASLRKAGIDTLVSLMTTDEALGLGLADESEAARAAGITFDTLATSDFAVPPSFAAAGEVIARILKDVRAGRGVGAHCYAGRGRSPMFVAAVLVHHGYEPAVAINAVSAARGVRIPETAAQQRWISEYAEWCRSAQTN